MDWRISMGKKKKKKKGEEIIEQISEETEPKEDAPYLLSLYGKIDEETKENSKQEKYKQNRNHNLK